MRVLVTGGTGYLGRVLVARYLERGDDVHALWHRSAPPADSPARWHCADLGDLAATRALVETIAADVVIHTAYAPKGDVELDVVTARAPGVIAEAASTTRARLVHLSTDVVFDGRDPGPSGYRETDALHPITDYGRAKARAEELVRAAHPAALVARTSLLYGGAEPGPQEQLVSRALDGTDRNLVFFTDEIRSVVAVGDLADALVELADLPIDGVLHVAGAEPISRHAFARLLAAAVSRGDGGGAGDALPSASSAGREPPRPQNCTLDSARARRLLTTARLRGASEVLDSLPPTPDR